MTYPERPNTGFTLDLNPGTTLNITGTDYKQLAYATLEIRTGSLGTTEIQISPGAAHRLAQKHVDSLGLENALDGYSQETIEEAKKWINQ